MRHPRERPRAPRGMTRRQFLRRSAGTAFALSNAGALLAACGRASETGAPSGGQSASAFPLARPDNPVMWPLYDDNPPIGSGLSPESNATLKIYNWADYLWKKVATNFAQEFGCKVELSTFGGVDEALSKIRTGQVDFDVYFPDPSLIGKLISAKLIQPLNHDYLPNLTNVWPQLQSPFYDLGSRYTVPYVIYTTGVAWRNDKVDVDIPQMANPYEIFWETRYRGKIHIFDDYRETIAMALLKNGIPDINTEDSANIDIAKQDLIRLVEQVNPKLDISDYTDLPEGISWIHQAWSGDMVSAQYYLPKGLPVDVLSYWYPPEGGGTIANDNMTILKSAKNPVLAHHFLNYLLDQKVAFDNFYNFVGYQPPQTNINPSRLVAEEVIPKNLETTVVSPEDFDRGHFLLELSPSGDAAWHSAYQEFAAGA
jgi:spermidine/putrescine transport system substrate-binding protein